jgi:hypothetical protein
MQSRRNFLKKAVVAAGVSPLPLLGWGEGFSTMLAVGINPAGEFSLLKLEKLLAGYQLPDSGKFSASSFNLGYKMYNLYGDNAVFAGEFHLNAEKKENVYEFGFANWRWADNGIRDRVKRFKYFVSGNVQCAADDTFSPAKWSVSSGIALSEGEIPFGGTGLTQNGEARNGEVTIRTSHRPIRKNFGQSPLSWKWGLPAVVQHMAEFSLPSLHFALLDEFDAIHQDQNMRFRKVVKLDCGGGRLVEFKLFELTGDGVIPTAFWVDDQNRTIFVISGMEAFVLN